MKSWTKSQQDARRKFSDTAPRQNGEAFKLTNGSIFTAARLHKIAKSRGSTAALSTIHSRLVSGMRDFDALIASSSPEKASSLTKAREAKKAKKETDTEFMAALAAVNARRAAR